MKWQPIETYPKERIGDKSWENRGTTVLFCNKTHFMGCGYWQWYKKKIRGEEGSWKINGYVPYSPPTHWMPLPPAPTEAP